MYLDDVHSSDGKQSKNDEASIIIFSSWFASGKSTTPLQLHVDLQIPGGLIAGWKIVK